MICYKDRCYCACLDCDNKNCDRLITKEILEDAERMDLPIDKVDLSEICRCYVKKTEL